MLILLEKILFATVWIVIESPQLPEGSEIRNLKSTETGPTERSQAIPRF